MEEEYTTLMRNNIWELDPWSDGSNIVTNKWIFTHKFLSNETFNYYKTRWFLWGFTERPEVDYGETFSPVVKSTIRHMVLVMAATCDWPIQNLDMKNAFLHGTLSETIYCIHPRGFNDSVFPDLIDASTSPCTDSSRRPRLV